MKNRNTSYNKIYNLLIGAIIFLVPTNFFLKFFEADAYVNGLQVDYLIPKLYLSDVFILSLLAIWFTNWLINLTKIKQKEFWGKLKLLLKKPWIITSVVLLTTFFLKQFWSSHPISSITYLLKIIELGLLAMFLVKNKKNIGHKLIEKAVLATLFFQSSIAIYQHINQKSILGYWLLGEPNLNNYIGVTKSSLFGIEKILPYGTTAHPNVLGGFLALYLLYIFSKVEWKHKIKLEILPNTVIRNIVKNLILILATVTLFLTQSVSAIATFMLGIIFIFSSKYWSNSYSKKTKKYLQQKFTLKNIIFLTATIFLISVFSLNLLAKKYPENQSLVRRNYLNSAAINMSRANLLTGVGLNNFTAKVENFSPNREIVRFVQPVHNIFLLFFAETGLLGIATLGIILSKFTKIQREQITIFQLQNIFKKKQENWSWIIILLPIALLDHYLLTLNTGMLMVIFAGIFLKQK